MADTGSFPGWDAVAARLKRGGYDGISASEATYLVREIGNLRRVPRLPTAAPEAKAEPLTRLAKPAKKRYRKGKPPDGVVYGKRFEWDAKSSGECPLCHRQLPHSTPAERKAHNYQLARMRGWRKRAAQLRAGAPGAAEFHAAHAARDRARGIERRAATFIEVAPHAAALLGPATVRRICAAYNKKQGYTQFRQWVGLHYGGKKPRAPWLMTPTPPLGV